MMSSINALSTGVRYSTYFLPTLRDTPSGADIASHKLMLRCGMIRQESAGIYSWLPLGFRVLTKISNIISQEQNAIGACEMIMPTVQSADLWRKSGRYADYGKEMLRFTDRHSQELLFGPTNEEMVTDIFANFTQSYKDLPKNVFQIQWKFRDELRPRFGVMRGREFLMKDGYGFAINQQQHRKIYNKIFVSYLRSFARMGVDVVPMQADTGPIGGNLSHEFIILAHTGESKVFCDKDILTLDIMRENIDYCGDLQPVVDKWTSFYATTEDMFVQQDWDKVSPHKQLATHGIEVGHIFYFGTKYSKPMGLQVENKDGQRVYVHMGSYGIGVSRVMAAIIEACHDEKGIVWPANVAPFSVGLINASAKDTTCREACEKIFALCQHNAIDVLYDDRDKGAGAKFSDIELIGIPWIVIVGAKNIQQGFVELKDRKTGTVEKIPVGNVLQRLKGYTGD